MTTKLFIITCIVLSFGMLHAQNNQPHLKNTIDSTLVTHHGPTRWIVAYQPGKAQTVNGLAVGLLGYDVICNAPYNQTTNGVNVQFGGGFVHWKKILFAHIYPSTRDVIESKSITNGLQLSVLGTQTDIVNGVSISGFVSYGERLNGLALNLGCNYYEEQKGISIGLRNTSHHTKGVQIGLFNKAENMSGLQIGLWNTIGERSLPLLNFSR